MKVETQIHLNKFQLREYQKPIWDAIENKGYKRVVYVAPRRSGKGIQAWNLCIRQCLRKVCLVFYVLPTYSQAKKTIFDAIAMDGTKFLDFLPREVVESINAQEMKIRFNNGSILQLIGGDSYNTSLVGTAPYGIVFDEFSLMNPEAYVFARPILAANDGWCLIQGTPRGRNAFWELYNLAKENADWFCYKVGLDETKHISDEALALERSQNSEEYIMQEWFCSFDRGVEGSFYSRYLDKLRMNNQVSVVPWESHLKTYTSWDIGVADATCIIFFQLAASGQIVRIIDCYSNTGYGLDHYAKVLQNKPYVYGKHFGPPDLKVREWAGGAVTRIDKARQLGISFTIVPDVGLDDGIEAVWTHFSKFYIDETKCAPLLSAIAAYRREYDAEKKRYKDKPLHDWSSNFCDALRYLAISLPRAKEGMQQSDVDRLREAALNPQGNLPKFFQPNGINDGSIFSNNY